MKKNIIKILLIISGFLSIFYYENRDFINANKINNIGINQYNEELYSFSIGSFMLASNLNENAIALYNIGNSHYQTAEENNDKNEKIAYYKFSLESYSGSLNLEYNQYTKDNYEYVEQKLDKLLNPEQETKAAEEEEEEEEEETENQGGEEQDSESNQEGKKQGFEESNSEGEEEQEGSETADSKEGNKTEEENGEKHSNGKDGNTGEEGDGEGKGNNQGEKLSQEQLQQIEKYSEDLKKTEYYNQKYFNKVKHDNLQNKSYDELFDIFERGGEKDW